MSRTTYRDPAVCRLVERAFVPVRVDADRRPDINERYNLGGWPTTVFLTPAGQLLGGETYVDAARMTALLERVAEAFARRHDEVNAPRTPPAGRAPEPPDNGGDLDRWLEQHLLERFDPQHGGFGTAPKHVHAAAVRFALRRSGAGAGPLREVASRTLDAIGWSGGVRRRGRRGLPLLRGARLDGAARGEAAGRQCQRARSVARGRPGARRAAIPRAGRAPPAVRPRHAGGPRGRGFLRQPVRRRRLLRGPGRRARPIGRSAGRTARCTPPGRRAWPRRCCVPPRCSATRRCSSSRSPRSSVWPATRTSGGGGVAHAVGDGEIARGLLADQVAVSDTLLDLYGATERDVYLDLAQELMRFCCAPCGTRAAAGSSTGWSPQTTSACCGSRSGRSPSTARRCACWRG